MRLVPSSYWPPSVGLQCASIRVERTGLGWAHGGGGGRAVTSREGEVRSVLEESSCGCWRAAVSWGRPCFDWKPQAKRLGEETMQPFSSGSGASHATERRGL